MLEIKALKQNADQYRELLCFKKISTVWGKDAWMAEWVRDPVGGCFFVLPHIDHLVLWVGILRCNLAHSLTL